MYVTVKDIAAEKQTVKVSNKQRIIPLLFNNSVIKISSTFQYGIQNISYFLLMMYIEIRFIPK